METAKLAEEEGAEVQEERRDEPDEGIDLMPRPDPPATEGVEPGISCRQCIFSFLCELASVWKGLVSIPSFLLLFALFLCFSFFFFFPSFFLSRIFCLLSSSFYASFFLVLILYFQQFSRFLPFVILRLSLEI